MDWLPALPSKRAADAAVPQPVSPPATPMMPVGPRPGAVSGGARKGGNPPSASGVTPGAANAFKPAPVKAAALVPITGPETPRVSDGMLRLEPLIAAATMGPLLFHVGDAATTWAADKLAPRKAPAAVPKVAFSILPGPAAMPVGEKLRQIGTGALNELGEQVEAMETRPIPLIVPMQQRENSPTMTNQFQAHV